jgi:hypothetical protein
MTRFIMDIIKERQNSFVRLGKAIGSHLVIYHSGRSQRYGIGIEHYNDESVLYMQALI